ncbi:unnamed protein product [Cylindrotheca closterium]|uniref:MYND-type domain-containing protein n=1 Tax=Cylindrotheca closterium TaxID=2856 RepID=A0AAD2PU04_9STRA|nr:unnamed protein product [Cylindrotheca closterium]
MLLTINMNDQTATQVAMCRRRTEINGIMARERQEICATAFMQLGTRTPSMKKNASTLIQIQNNFQRHGPCTRLHTRLLARHAAIAVNQSVMNRKRFARNKCTMAWYCDLNCQKADWKAHKKCCKKLKRGVDLVLGSGKRKLVPYPLVEQTGFVEDFDESKNQMNQVPANGRDRFDYEYAWEYHGVDELDPTKRVWKKYPPLISYSIECLRDLGSPAYIYIAPTTTIVKAWNNLRRFQNRLHLAEQHDTYILIV